MKYSECSYEQRLEIAEEEGWAYQIRNKSDRKAVELGCYYSEKAGSRVIDFFRDHLKHIKGSLAGKPFILLDWQQSDFKELYGWLRADGTRRFRTAYIEVPKKNGKTTVCGGLLDYMLAGDGEVGAEVYTAATTRAQAGLCFKTAAQMVRTSPALSEHLRVLNSTSRIIYDAIGGFISAVSSEADNEEGLDASCVVVDELHVMKKRALWDCLRYSGAARSQPLIIAITTAGIYDPESIGWEIHKYAQDVLDETIEDYTFFSRIYTVPTDMDWRDEEAWFIANPSLGEVIDLEMFRENFNEAINSPSKINNFKRYRLNIWTAQKDIYFPYEKVQESERTELSLADFVGKKNFVGVDLASISDMAAIAVLHKDHNPDKLRMVTRCWLPEDIILPSNNNVNRELYERWESEGWLTLTPGNSIDYNFIFDELLEIEKEIGVVEFGIDPWNATDITTRLMDVYGEDRVVKVRQGSKTLSDPTKYLLKMVLDGDFEFDASPITLWAFNNVCVDEDSNENVKPTKMSKASKIDPVAAAITALSRLLVSPTFKPSKYEKEGLINL